MENRKDLLDRAKFGMGSLSNGTLTLREFIVNFIFIFCFSMLRNCKISFLGFSPAELSLFVFIMYIYYLCDRRIQAVIKLIGADKLLEREKKD